MLELITNPEIWVAFATLTLLEIVLGIDNIIFISILTGRLPQEQQARGRFLGLGLAMIMRLGLLFCLSYIMQLTSDLFTVMDQGISGRDIILIVGGAFLMGKSTREVHNALEGEEEDVDAQPVAGFVGVLIQIALIDVVFSLDSVITAVGLVDQIEVMVAAIVVAVLVMMVASGPISRFVEDHPTIKMLALTFLLMIGLTLLIEGFDVHVPKGYIYFAMAFSFGVEMLNVKAQKGGRKESHVKLRKTQLGDLVRGSTSSRTEA